MKAPAAESYGFDPRNPDFLANPYPVYRALRLGSRPCWSSGAERWLVADHAECSRLLRSTALVRQFANREPQDRWGAFNWLNADGILDIEGTRHHQLRRWLSPAFTRSSLATIEDLVGAACDAVMGRALERAGASGQVDLVSDVFEPLPAVVICQLLGIDEDLGPSFREWSIAFVHMFEYATSEDDQRAGIAAANALAETMGRLLDAGHARPGSLITELDRLRASGDITDREAVANAVLLFNGGTGAVVNALGNGFAELLKRPDQLAEASRAANAEGIVEEFLRYEAPLQAFERVATRDLAIGDAVVRQGERVTLLLGSANRDEAAFPEPDVFDVGRPPGPTLTFGAGTHFCLGAPLARLEMQALIPRLLTAMPDLELAAEPVPDLSFVVRGYSSIPVHVG